MTVPASLGLDGLPVPPPVDEVLGEARNQLPDGPLAESCIAQELDRLPVGVAGVELLGGEYGAMRPIVWTIRTM